MHKQSIPPNIEGLVIIHSYYCILMICWLLIRIKSWNLPRAEIRYEWRDSTGPHSETYVTDEPNWNIPGAEYRLTPFEEEKVWVQ